jgi:HK97 family phage portal protein
MGFLTRWLERRYVTLPSGFDTSDFGVGPTASSICVTPEKALEVPAVFACLQVLCQDIGRTPIKFRRRIADDAFVDATEHDLWELLHSLPNAETTAFQFKHQMQWNLLLHGRAYAEIVRVEGRVVALWPLDPQRMQTDRDASRRKRWRYTTAAGTVTTWTFDASQPPILELVHETPISRCQELIGTALALQIYTAKFFANGGRIAGVLQAQGQVSQATADRLRAFWASTFGRPENSHKIAILDGGLEYKALASQNNDAQMIETMGAITQAICGVFRVPTWKVGDLSRATYSNMSAGELSYITSTLDPFFQCWEDAIRRDLLTNRQYTQFTAAFDRNALIRSDLQAQHAALATGIQAGFYSQNDARRTLGLNPIADGDRYMVNSALVPIADVGDDDAEPAVA